MDEEGLIRCIELRLGMKGVKMDDRFYEDLGAESIDMVHIAVTVESQTGVFIPEEIFPELGTVRILYEYIRTRQQA